MTGEGNWNGVSCRGLRMEIESWIGWENGKGFGSLGYLSDIEKMRRGKGNDG